MDNEKLVINPFFGTTVGSTVAGNNFGPSIITTNITKMITQKNVEKDMSGQSQYVYSDRLNEGTLGVSGSYGVSGISKFTSALSTHFGNSKAESALSINVNYNITMISGIEYINFDDLTAEHMLSSLSSGPKELALDVLNKFIAVRDHADQNTGNKEKLLNDWLKSLQYFLNMYGDGLVVGVVWGGLGTVTTSMSSSSAENNWTYGEGSEFAYSSTGSSVSVKQSYNGSKSEKLSEVNVNCHSWASGGCAEEQVDLWFEHVSNKSFSEIADVVLLDKAPTPNKVSAPPSIPDFVKPIIDTEIIEKLEPIKELGETGEFSTFAGFEEAKKTDKYLTFEEFKKKANNKSPLDKVEQLTSKIMSNQLDVLASKLYTGKTVQLSSQSMVRDSPPSDHAPLGVWILNWPAIFPWMSMGYMNEITDTSLAEELLKKRCMLQDLSMLSTIYYTLHSCNISYESFTLVKAIEIANSFSKAQAMLKSTFEQDDAIQRTFKEMTNDAKAIYKKWNELGFLRNAELGLGLLVNGEKSLTPDVVRVNSFPYAEVVYKTETCSKHYVAFSTMLKLIPMIDTNGDIYAFGPSSMMLKNTKNNEITFTKAGLTAMKFVPNIADGTLVNGDNVLIPIPYSAADGIKWLGQGLGKSLSSSTSLNQQMDDLKKELGNLNICSFSSENWSRHWKSTDSYHLRSLRTSYIGLIDRINNIFN